MEFLTTAVQFVKELLLGNYVTAGILVAPFVLPNVLVEKTFYSLGRTLSFFLRQKIGRQGEKVEGYFQGTVNAMILGLNTGLDEDNSRASE